MARFYHLTPLERRVVEALISTSHKSTVMNQHRFKAADVLTALNGAGVGVSEEAVDEILGRLEALDMISLIARTPIRLYRLVERDGDFLLHEVVDRAADIEARDTTVIHCVEAEMLDTLLRHDHLDTDGLAQTLEPLSASGADGVRPVSAFAAWVKQHFLDRRKGEHESRVCSPQFPPFWVKAAPWVSRLGVQSEGVTVDKVFYLAPDDIEVLYKLTTELKLRRLTNAYQWFKDTLGDDELGHRCYHRFLSQMRVLFHVPSDTSLASPGWGLSPEFSRNRFVVVGKGRVNVRMVDLENPYRAHPDHAYWQLAVLAGRATEVQAEREMGTEVATPPKDAPAPPASASAPLEPPPAAPESAPAAEAAAVPAPVVTDAVRQDAEASAERVRSRGQAHQRLDAYWREAQEEHRRRCQSLIDDIERLREELIEKETVLGTVAASPPVPSLELALRKAEFKDAICRHNMAYGDVLLLDDTGAHVVLPIPVAAPPAATPPPPSEPPAAPVAASGGSGSAATPHSGNGMTEWDDAAKEALVERILAAGEDRRTEIVDAFIAEHSGFNAMSVRATASRMAGDFEETFCRSYTKGRVGKDRTRAIHRLATFYRKSPADITRVVGPAQ